MVGYHVAQQTQHVGDSKHKTLRSARSGRLKTRFSAALSRNFRECSELLPNTTAKAKGFCGFNMFDCHAFLRTLAMTKARILRDFKSKIPCAPRRRAARQDSASWLSCVTLGSGGNSLADTTAKAKGFCSFKYAIALTGGIATGKSTAAALLQEHGYALIDADTIAHEVLTQHAARVIDVFGRGICDADSNIDRKKLGAIVFADPEKLRVLESIVHPIIAQTIYDKAAALEQRKTPFFVDIPIFFEKRELFAFVSKSVLVYAPPDVQLARLRARNNLSLEEAQQRIAAQIPIDVKKQQADDIIDNSGDVQTLRIQVERYLERLRSEYGL